MDDYQNLDFILDDLSNQSQVSGPPQYYNEVYTEQMYSQQQLYYQPYYQQTQSGYYAPVQNYQPLNLHAQSYYPQDVPNSTQPVATYEVVLAPEQLHNDTYTVVMTQPPKSEFNIPKLSNATFKCTQCPRVFKKACYLKQHFNARHNGVKAFRCEKCGKRFATKDKLEIHFAKHTGNKPFHCMYCPKQFHYKSDLTRHMVEHGSGPLHCCEVCHKGFARRDHLEDHRRTHSKISNLVNQLQ